MCGATEWRGNLREPCFRLGGRPQQRKGTHVTSNYLLIYQMLVVQLRLAALSHDDSMRADIENLMGTCWEKLNAAERDSAVAFVQASAPRERRPA